MVRKRYCGEEEGDEGMPWGGRRGCCGEEEGDVMGRREGVLWRGGRGCCGEEEGGVVGRRWGVVGRRKGGVVGRRWGVVGRRKGVLWGGSGVLWKGRRGVVERRKGVLWGGGRGVVKGMIMCKEYCLSCSYESGGWGWNDKEKWEELTDDAAWCVKSPYHVNILCSLTIIFFSFLLAKETATQKLQGYVNFRFDLDEQLEVVYW